MSHADTLIQLMAQADQLRAQADQLRAQAEHRKQMPLKCKCCFLIITDDFVRFVFRHIMNVKGTHELNLVGLAKLFLIIIKNNLALPTRLSSFLPS